MKIHNEQDVIVQLFRRRRKRRAKKRGRPFQFRLLHLLLLCWILSTVLYLAVLGVTRVHQQYTRLRSDSLSRPPQLHLAQNPADYARRFPTIGDTQAEANDATISSLDADVMEESGREFKKRIDSWRQDHRPP